jgi:hypothetical protein
MEEMDINPWLEHLGAWLNKQFANESEALRFSLRKAMVAELEKDPEYWVNQDYWRLYDEVQKGGKHPFA